MTLDDLGTLEQAGLTTEDIQELAASLPAVTAVTDVQELQDGLNCTAIASVKSESLPESLFLKLGTFNIDGSFAGEPFVLARLQDTAVSAPTPLYYDFSRDFQPLNWYVTTVVAGESRHPDTEAAAVDLAAPVGTLLGTVNSHSLSTTGPSDLLSPTVPETGDPTTIDADVFTGTDWPTVVEDELTSLVHSADARFADQKDAILDFIDSHKSVLPSVDDPRLLHLDYWWENLLWTDGEPIPIDWQRAYAGDPWLNFVLADHLLFKQDWPEASAAFETAYRDALTGNPDPSEEVLRLYRLYPLLREMRGFPYWWKHLSDSEQDAREETVREAVQTLLD